MNLSKFRIGTRLGAGFGMLLVLIAAIAAMGAASVDQVHDGLKTVYEDRVVPLQQLAQVNALVLRNRILVMDMMANPEPANIDKRDTELGANIAAAAKLWLAYTATYMTPKEKELANAFAASQSAYVQEGLLAVRDAVRSARTASKLSRWRGTPRRTLTN